MVKAFFAAAWSFVFAVAAFDVYFAWSYRAYFDAWEMNPLARWAAHSCGLAAVFAIKLILIGFVGLVGAYCCRSRHWLAAPYTAYVGGVHLILSVHYLAGYLSRY